MSNTTISGKTRPQTYILLAHSLLPSSVPPQRQTKFVLDYSQLFHLIHPSKLEIIFISDSTSKLTSLSCYEDRQHKKCAKLELKSNKFLTPSHLGRCRLLEFRENYKFYYPALDRHWENNEIKTILQFLHHLAKT